MLATNSSGVADYLQTYFVHVYVYIYHQAFTSRRPFTPDNGHNIFIAATAAISVNRIEKWECTF